MLQRFLNWAGMSVVDIKSAYRAVPIRQEHRKYMAFEWEIDGVYKVFINNSSVTAFALGLNIVNTYQSLSMINC